MKGHKLIAIKAPAMRFEGESVNHLGTLSAWSAECECGWDSMRTASPEDAQREHRTHLVDCKVAPEFWKNYSVWKKDHKNYDIRVPLAGEMIIPRLIDRADIQEGDIFAQVQIQGPEFPHIWNDVVLLVAHEG